MQTRILQAQQVVSVVNMVVLLLLIVFGLLYDLPQLIQPEDESISADLFALTQFSIAVALFNLPYDTLGMMIWRNQQPEIALSTVLVQYLRGLFVHTTLFILTGLLILIGGRALGILGAWMVQGTVMLWLIIYRLALAQLMTGGEQIRKNMNPENRHLEKWGLEVSNIIILKNVDKTLTGGFSGLPRREQLMIPAHWLEDLTAEQAAIQIIRRVGAIASKSRMFGVIIAALLAWGGFGLALLAPGGGSANSAELITSILIYSLMTFVFMTIIAPLNRKGVFICDRYVSRKGIPKRLISKTIDGLDRSSTPPVLSTANSLPDKSTRIAQLRYREQPFGAWNCVPMLLYFSWSGLNIFSRNWGKGIGRSDLWVYPPSD